MPHLIDTDEIRIKPEYMYDICGVVMIRVEDITRILNDIPPAQSESCKGCKHIGLWENEVEYGYSSPCTRCKRRVSDNYER